LSSKLGNHFIIGLSDTKLSKRETETLSKLSPAGIILFKHNLSDSEDWPEQLHSLIQEAKEACGRDKIIVSIDHEGGKVHRLREPVTKFPAACCWGEDAANVGQGMGKELSAIGFNLNFAPVLDIHSEESNPIIGERAFGTSAEEVGQRAAQFLAAMEAEGVKGCGKHFPGHGDTRTDSHLELPVLDWTLEELREREIFPFKKLIEGGIGMLMTAHVLYPALDSENPATLSHTILQTLLREELGFEGLVISDALEMKALRQEERNSNILRAVNAGVDLLLMAQSEDSMPVLEALEAVSYLEENRNQISVDLNASCLRIANWLSKLPEKESRSTSLEQCASESSELCQKLEKSYLTSQG